MEIASFVTFFIRHLRNDAVESDLRSFFEDSGNCRYQRIVVFCAFQVTMSHAFAQIHKLVIKTETFINPFIDIYNGIMVPECIS